MSDLVGNPEDWFSHATAHIIIVKDCLHVAFVTKQTDFNLVISQTADRFSLQRNSSNVDRSKTNKD